VAQSLADDGIAPGERLAVAQENITDMVVGIIAGLKVGAAIAPINPRLGSEEKQTIFDVLGSARILKDLPGGETVFTSDEVAPETASIILFTSGSTGLPKGVVLSQRAVTAGLDLWIEASLALRPDDVVISVLPLAHSYGLFGTLLAPLLVSAKSVLVPRFSPEAVLEAVEQNEATIFSGVATMFRRILDSGVLEGSDLSSLRFCTSGAAPCPWELAEEWREASGVRIVRGYGMSELFRPICYSPEDIVEIPESIGHAPNGVELKLVDEAGKTVTGGLDAVGELWIKSPACMTEYIDRPEETLAVIENGWFKTGDLARITPEGLVCIVGRKKEIILRGGYTIAAGEIENALVAHPDVAEAAVIGVPDREMGEEICAYVALRPGAAADQDTLVEFCRQRLSSYKYPRIMHFVAELPKNATGKIDKTGLKG
jgi:long-chain acyl-CoA synthetase